MPRVTLVLVLLVAACSSSSTTPLAGNLPDATPAMSGADAAGSPGADAGDNPTPTGMGNPAPGVLCGAAACLVDEKCCSAQPPAMPAACIAKGDPCARASVSCDGPEDCDPGSVCCFGAATSDYPAAACHTACAMTDFRLCHTDSNCEAGSVCCMGQYPPFWGVAFRRCQPGPKCPESP